MIYVGTGWGAEDWLGTPEVAERIRETWRELLPLVEWGRTHVGSSELEYR